MTKATMTAIQKRISNGEYRFHIGAYYYEADINGILRRREQRVGCLPTSNWERVGSWDPATGEVSA